MAERSQRYARQPDPKADAPLAWVFMRDGRQVASTPDYRFGQYKKIVVGPETWFVHCSFAGALDFVLQALGEGNVEVDENAGTAQLTVPADMVGSWKGSHCCVISFLKHMFGANDDVRVIGDANWRRR